VKPTLISAELASFLGKTAGTEMARTEVTREINAYIRDHQLQDKANGRIINADTKLSSLLKIPAGEELTYFNLQRYMSPHFTKSVVASA
jgi:upstream activation factor subunit UAF30